MSLESYWYRRSLHPLLIPLLPFSLLFGLLSNLRRWSYRLGLKKSQQFALPVIIVGNISLGGTGKTPLTITLANYLKEQGKKPGIALRGEGGKRKSKPLLVEAEADPFEVGDEAVLIARQTQAPVAVCIDRPAAVQALVEAGCDVVLCDDGLQHYRLARQVEILVIDGSRYFGNGFLLPAGPLRESPRRLKEVDFVVVQKKEQAFQTQFSSRSQLNIKQLKPSKIKKSFRMELKAEAFEATHFPRKILPLSAFSGQKVHALAGIGNPQGFFDLLTHFQIEVLPHRFPDHYRYKSKDLNFSDQLPILMTEKDAVKCKRLVFDDSLKEKQWFLRVNTELSPDLKQAVFNKIEDLGKQL